MNCFRVIQAAFVSLSLVAASPTTSSSSSTNSSCTFGGDTAFLFFDFQQTLLNLLPNSTLKTDLLNNVASLLNDVRSIQHGDVAQNQPRLPLIIHSQILFTPGYPEISLNNPFISIAPSVYNVTIGSPTADFIPSLEPNISNGEVVVHKTRFNSALRTSLVTALESQSVKKVVLSGYATTGAILATSTYLSDLDYQVFVVRDNVLDSGDLSRTNPNELETGFNGTTLTDAVLNVVLKNFVTPVSLTDVKAGLC